MKTYKKAIQYKQATNQMKAKYDELFSTIGLIDNIDNYQKQLFNIEEGVVTVGFGLRIEGTDTMAGMTEKFSVADLKTKDLVASKLIGVILEINKIMGDC